MTNTSKLFCGLKTPVCAHYSFIEKKIKKKNKSLFCSVHKAATNYKKRQMLGSLKAFPATTVSLCTSQQAGSE